MQKIGILTFHSSDNYGAVLQAYALHNFLVTHLEADVEIINFSTIEQQKSYRILNFDKKKSLWGLLSALLYLLLFKLPIFIQLRTRKYKFSRFRKDFLILTCRFWNKEELFENLPMEDVYITGSDQVFNPYGKYTDVYYLGFNKGKSKKIAYAPSFGVSNFKESVGERLRGLLMDFDAISCREQVGADFLTEILAKPISCVADPVFLLTKEEWFDIAKVPNAVKRYKGRFIFVYRLNGGKPLMKLAKKVSDATGLPIVCLSMDCRNRMGARMIYTAGPLEILGLIKESSYVITDSFHGTALSLVLRKKIIPYIASLKNASRITSIMDKFDMLKNVVYNVDDFNIDALRHSNYEVAMSRYIEYSKAFLLKEIKQ